MSKVVVPFLRSAFNYDRNQASDDSGLECEAGSSLTQQSFAEEVDINTIVRRFDLDGQIPEGVRMPMSGDFTGVFDFQSAMNAIVLARESFDAMPARVRARFHNDPAEFVDFCADEANRAEAEKLGLVPVKAAAAAQALVGDSPPAPAVPAPAAAPVAPKGG